ncbi:MAG: hypothetical protein LKJ76_06665 [Lachnospiraceae bacterium]|jgi:hypothetical protein|nr:hypothetical protein [Lachnospiraceae bacterium]
MMGKNRDNRSLWGGRRFAAAGLAAVIAAGLAFGSVSMNVKAASGSSTLDKLKEAAQAAAQAATQVSEAASQVAVAASQAAGESVAASADAQITMTQDEVKKVSAALNIKSQYGFLLSEYTDVRDVDLNEIFYSGAGLKEPEDAGKCANFYKSLRLEDEDALDQMDYVVLTSSQISSYLKKYTGYTLGQMKTRLTDGNNWYYVKKYDSYICWHGDTNAVPITFTEGKRVGNSYALGYLFGQPIYDAQRHLVMGGVVVFQYDGKNVRFISNDWVPDK